jgi:NTE family protein
VTTAFVLWGGGSLGAAQVGMLRALTVRGVRADLLVGASVGALNAAYFAARPDEQGVEDLARLWLEVGRHDVNPLSTSEAVRTLVASLPLHPVRGILQAFGTLNYTFPIGPWALVEALAGRRNYLFPHDRLERFLRQILPIGDLKDTKIPVAVLVAEVRSGRSVSLSQGPAVPALLASAAIPGIYPTVTIDGQTFMDGGVAHHTTLDYAIEAGADEVYVLTPGFSCDLPAPPSTVVAMALHTYNLLGEQRMHAAVARAQRRARLHLIPPLCPVEVLPIDFGQTAELIDNAAAVTGHWLDKGEPKPGLARTLGDFHNETG